MQTRLIEKTCYVFKRNINIIGSSYTSFEKEKKINIPYKVDILSSPTINHQSCNVWLNERKFKK